MEWCHRSWRTQLPGNKLSPRRQVREVHPCCSVNRGKKMKRFWCYSDDSQNHPCKCPLSLLIFQTTKQLCTNRILICTHELHLNRPGLTSEIGRLDLTKQSGYRFQGKQQHLLLIYSLFKQTAITSKMNGHSFDKVQSLAFIFLLSSLLPY